MSQEFTSHDGGDANGVRAEVIVVKGKGIVKDAVLGNNDKSVQASIFEENLALPIKGWANVDTAIHRELLRAKESGEQVEYRIEIQRKNHIDRNLPMDEVRPKGDMLTANKNAIRILAQINDVVSDEAVTHPSEDLAPAFGRFKAVAAGETKGGTSSGSAVSIAPEALTAALEALSGTATTQDVQAAAVGAAIVLGLDPAEALKAISTVGPAQERPTQRPTFSAEGKPWDIWNSDGHENLGHARFAAGVGAEAFVRTALTKAGITDAALEDGTSYFTNLVLSIADRVQVKAYGEGFRPDRAAGSHTRIRGIVYDTIENYYPLPLTAGDNAVQAIKTWIAEVGSQTFERLQIVIQVSNAVTSFNAPLPELIFGAQKAPVVEKKPEPVVTPAHEPAPAEEEPEAEKEVEVAVTEPEPVIEVPAVETVAPEEAEKETAEESDEPVVLFAPIDIDALPESEREDIAHEETVAEFRALIEDAEIPDAQLKLVASLLRKTFGDNYSKAQLLPESVLADFVDFYINAGPDNFKKAIQNS